MLAYSKVSKAEKIRRRLAILDVQAQKYIKESEHAVAKGARTALAPSLHVPAAAAAAAALLFKSV